MEIKTSVTFGSLAESKLLEFERKHGISLPQDYRKFLLEHNGGQPAEKTTVDFREQDTLTSSDVRCFYGIHKGEDWARIEWYLQVLQGRLVEEGLAIAGDSGGNQYVLIVAGERKGYIYFWDHERETSPPGYDNMSYVASSFTAFCEALYETISPAESEEESILREGDVQALINLLDSGYDLEHVDQHNRTMIENAAIHNRPEIIQLLFDRGAQLRNALRLAERNYAFFPEHKAAVDLLRDLSAQRSD